MKERSAVVNAIAHWRPSLLGRHYKCVINHWSFGTGIVVLYLVCKARHICSHAGQQHYRRTISMLRISRKKGVLFPIHCSNFFGEGKEERSDTATNRIVSIVTPHWPLHIEMSRTKNRTVHQCHVSTRSEQNLDEISVVESDREKQF